MAKNRTLRAQSNIGALEQCTLYNPSLFLAQKASCPKIWKLPSIDIERLERIFSGDRWDKGWLHSSTGEKEHPCYNG